mmetsp:Transcript_10077/g.21776  ORF Transcript_10077/g.21776 Transcript_10077/m.21776 type:complete len:90 (+) Transcript_10077:571-840(+)
MLELREPNRHDVVVALLEVVSPLRNTLARTKDTDSLDTDSRDTDSADALPSPKTDLLEHGVLTLANGSCEENRKKGCLEVVHGKKQREE